MPTDVVMPQMGESIAEGTLVRWIKQVGETVDRDEPLFEISTDKVDAEIPSPAAGILTRINVKEGETVPINSVVAIIGQAAEDGVSSGPVEQPPGTSPAAASPHVEVKPAPEVTARAVPVADATGRDERRRQRSSPLVRRLAREHGIDIGHITGSGLAGRVTKEDIERQASTAPPREAPPFEAGQPTVRVPMTIMRRRIAEHMIASQRTSAHVHSVFEVDFSRVQEIRSSYKARYERAGVRLTFTAFIAKVAMDALQAMPIFNASLDGEHVVYKRDINLGIAVALESGLIVPVIRHADEKNLLGLSRAIEDLADRARARQLSPEDVQGGTFTVTNPGSFGALFGTPIINQPQVAILGVGTIEKRPVVVHDAIAIRSLAYLTLGFDHRLIDGVVADQFMGHVKRGLEQFEESIL